MKRRPVVAGKKGKRVPLVLLFTQTSLTEGTWRCEAANFRSIWLTAPVLLTPEGLKSSISPTGGPFRVFWIESQVPNAMELDLCSRDARDEVGSDHYPRRSPRYGVRGLVLARHHAEEDRRAGGGLSCRMLTDTALRTRYGPAQRLSSDLCVSE